MLADYSIQSYRSPTLKSARDYAVYCPAAGTSDRNPIIFLHGSGECGDDIDVPAKSWGPLATARQRELPFAVIVPQLPSKYWDDKRDWLNFEDDIDQILTDVTRRYGVDTETPYLTGISLGACGAWELGATPLRRWSAIAAFAGGTNDTSLPQHVAARLVGTPCWGFVNRFEKHVDIPSDVYRLVDALESAGGDVRKTYFNNRVRSHRCWENAYLGHPMWSRKGTEMLPRISIYEWFRCCAGELST